MRTTLPHRLFGTVTAAVIALTAFTAVPVYADDERAARAIATILGLAVVGKIIHDARKDRRNDHSVAPVKTYTYDNHANRPRHQPQNKKARRLDQKQLPQQCFRNFQTRQGTVQMFARRCLERNYRYVNRMPQSCAQRVRTLQGNRSGFDARCLRRNGYRLARG